MRRSRRTWANAPPRPTSRAESRRRLEVTRRNVAEHQERNADLSPEDLDEQSGEELPEREAMSVVDPNAAAGLTVLAPTEPDPDTQS
jgi:hypothetical protein